jgi:hypothetical protein
MSGCQEARDEQLSTLKNDPLDMLSNRTLCEGGNFFTPFNMAATSHMFTEHLTCNMTKRLNFNISLQLSSHKCSHGRMFHITGQCEC